jgi:GABA permease
MRNPFGTEEDAYRMVWVVVVICALIVGGAAINTWLGLAIALLAVAAWGVWLGTRKPRERRQLQHPSPHPPGEHRVLVIANETVGGAELLSEVRSRVRGGERGRVLVVALALNSPLRHWVSDEDAAREEARERLNRSLTAMRAAGIPAEGEIGDSDPLQAIDDALRTFAPDELVISTHPPGRSNWLERGVPEAARERFALPTTHVVVDLERESSSSAQPAAAGA